MGEWGEGVTFLTANKAHFDTFQVSFGFLLFVKGQNVVSDYLKEKDLDIEL